MTNKPFLSVNNITIRNADSFFFENTSWTLRTNEQWLIYGPNGSGKSTFAKAIAGLLPTKHGEIILHFIGKHNLPFPSVHKDRIAYLAFETQQKLLQKDSLKRDFESYMGVEIQGSLVKDFLGLAIPASYTQIFSIEQFLDREIATLSTGEMRKVFLLKALMQDPDLLILDEPFDGLDQQMKHSFMQVVNGLMKKGIHVILIVHRLDEIPENITHILLVKDCKVFAQGEKEKMLKRMWEVGSGKLEKESSNFNIHPFGSEPQGRRPLTSNLPPLIEMKNVTVKFGNKIILDNINWTCRKGENWVILGHNGAGKSTLVQLVLGDQLQAYANNITVFGKKKDIGISVWEIKEHIGVVSTDLMLKYNKDMSAYNVILSGFFDSIGLYRSATDEQKKQADEWIKHLNLEDLVKRNYHQLSFGQKRLILIARSVVKNQKLLILDEPCHGLDIANRKKVLELINAIGNSGPTNILLITHNSDDIVPCITHMMKLEKGKILEISNISQMTK